MSLSQDGYLRFRAEGATRTWAAAALRAGQAILTDPTLRECQGTWAPGVDALPNDAAGTVDCTPLTGAAITAAQALVGPLPLHPGQISAVWPGYPQPRAGEGAAAFRYRQNRDAAHVDGLLPVGTDRRRMIKEPHAWILGIGLTDGAAGAAPLVIWPGSHRVLGAAFHKALADAPQPDQVDVTEVYQATRKHVFETYARQAVPLGMGEAVLLHRHLLHGIGPWIAPAGAPRATAYFRPLLAEGRGWGDPSW